MGDGRLVVACADHVSAASPPVANLPVQLFGRDMRDFGDRQVANAQALTQVILHLVSGKSQRLVNQLGVHVDCARACGGQHWSDVLFEPRTDGHVLPFVGTALSFNYITYIMIMQVQAPGITIVCMKSFERPPVDISNYNEVYDFYATHQQNVVGAKLAYCALNKYFKPRLRYADDAWDEIDELVKDDVSIIIAPNHLTYSDHYVIAGAAWDTPVRPEIGHARVLAKDELFRGKTRRPVDMMGGIPTFRTKNHDTVMVSQAADRMVDITAQRLANGDHVGVFAEGTCNDQHPQTLTQLKSGLARIALRARDEYGARVAIMTMGVSFGEKQRGTKDTDVRGAIVYVNSPVVQLPDNVQDLTEVVRDSLQASVTAANDIAYGRTE